MKSIVTLILASVLLIGSVHATENPYVRNGVNGAVVGGGIGAIVGNNTGSHNGKKGAVIGALVGTLLAVNNTRAHDAGGYGTRQANSVQVGDLDYEISRLSRQLADEQAEADRLQAVADAAQRRTSEVRNRLYNLQSARDSLIRASR